MVFEFGLAKVKAGLQDRNSNKLWHVNLNQPVILKFQVTSHGFGPRKSDTRRVKIQIEEPTDWHWKETDLRDVNNEARPLVRVKIDHVTDRPVGDGWAEQWNLGDL